MTIRIVTEPELQTRLRELLPHELVVGSVTGPGRSGAMAAVYASHILGVPFIPYKSRPPTHLGPLLIIDTARESGKTLRKAEKFYDKYDTLTIVAFEEPPRVRFWYENLYTKGYRHDGTERAKKLKPIAPALTPLVVPPSKALTVVPPPIKKSSAVPDLTGMFT